MSEADYRRMAKKGLSIEGLLAATLAHELKNPMQALGEALFLLNSIPNLDDRVQRCVDVAQKELERMIHITNNVLTLYRPPVASIAVDLAAELDAVLNFYEDKIRFKKIQVEKRYSGSVSIQAAPGEMRQIFTNVIVNALEAVPAGGRLLIHLFPSRAWSGGKATGIRVVFADNGPGIEPERQRIIFEPLYSTKDGKGAGLGLWLTRALVQKCGGFLRVHSSTRTGRNGTCFSMFLPSKLGRDAAAGKAAIRRRAADQSKEKGLGLPSRQPPPKVA